MSKMEKILPERGFGSRRRLRNIEIRKKKTGICFRTMVEKEKIEKTKSVTKSARYPPRENVKRSAKIRMIDAKENHTFSNPREEKKK